MDLARETAWPGAESSVSSDLENLEMSGNFDARRKNQGKVSEFKKKIRKAREFWCVKYIFSQSEHPNFEILKISEGACHRPLNSLETQIRN